MKKTTFIADGKNKKFSFNFPFFLKSNIIVTVNGAPATNYNTVCVSNGMNANIPFGGGYVIFTRAPRHGDVVTISRDLPLDRFIDYQPTAEINPTAINHDFNYLIEILKDLVSTIADIVAAPSESQNKEEIKEVRAQITQMLSDIEELGTRITAGGTGDGDGTPTVDLSEIEASITALSTRCNELAAAIEEIDTGAGTTLPAGADYVVESQLPTAENNYTWYRKYASGWVEQGGVFSLPAFAGNGTVISVNINLPVEMADALYFNAATPYEDNGCSNHLRVASSHYSTTTVLKLEFGNSGPNLMSAALWVWSVCGQSAPATE